MDGSQDQDKELGFIFIPFKERESIGFKELIINIAEIPSGKHFDPVAIDFFAATKDQTAVEEFTVFHPYSNNMKMDIVAGKIDMKDKKGKREEAFSFGGSLHILSQSENTQCRLVSNAPILPLNPRNTPVHNLLDEIQILMAERKAAWIQEGEEAFEKKLINIDPLQLCVVCLNTILKEFSDPELQSLGTNRILVDLIRKEINYLKESGMWPAEIPSIVEIL